MKRNSMFTTHNLLTTMQKGYHDKIKRMKDDMIDFYSNIDLDDTPVDGVMPLVNFASCAPPTQAQYNTYYAKPCKNAYNYISEAMLDFVNDIESNEVSFLISCMMKNGILKKNSVVKARMIRILNLLKSQIVDIEGFVIYELASSCNQYGVIILINGDDPINFSRSLVNIEFIMSNAGISRPTIIKSDNYSSKCYRNPVRFDYDVFANKLSLHIEEPEIECPSYDDIPQVPIEPPIQKPPFDPDKPVKPDPDKPVIEPPKPPIGPGPDPSLYENGGMNITTINTVTQW